MYCELLRAALLWSLVAASAAIGGTVEKEHSDVHLLLPDGPTGAIDTGAVQHDEPGEPVLPGVRVWAVELGESVPGYTDEPGFAADPDVFDPFTYLGIQVLDVLRVWDSADGNFEAQAPTTMFIGLGSASVNTPATAPLPSDPPIGFHFDVVLEDEEVHAHLNFFLNPPQDTGVYLLKARVVANEPAFAPFPAAGGPQASEAIYLVFNHNDSHENADAALQFVIDELVGGFCPGDANGSGAIDFDDLNLVLANWGAAGPDGDLDDSDTIDFNDLNLVLTSFGAECPA